MSGGHRLAENVVMNIFDMRRSAVRPWLAPALALAGVFGCAAKEEPPKKPPIQTRETLRKTTQNIMELEKALADGGVLASMEITGLIGSRSGGTTRTGHEWGFRLPDAVRRPGSPFPAGFGTDRVVAPPSLRVHVGPRVVKVQADRLVSHPPEPHTSMDQSLAEFTIETTVLQPFVEAVDPQRIGAPDRGVVTVEAGLRWREPVRQPACRRARRV
jgi:hypothetical protein